MKAPSARELFFATRQLDDAQQQALETRFFHSLRLPNGTYKTTYARRMGDVDAALCDLLPTDRTLRLLDVGVSSGVTTLELLQAMESRGLRREATAVDLSLNAFLVRRLGLELLVDPRGRVLQIATPFGAKGRPHDPASSPLRAVLQGAIVAAESLVGGAAGAARGEAVRLVTPRLLRRDDVQLVEHDLQLREPRWVDRFDVVRAANIINRDYFAETVLRSMIAHLRDYLRVDGVLCLSATDDDTRENHATLFRKDAAGALVPLRRVGLGSEVETLAAELAGDSGASAA